MPTPDSPFPALREALLSLGQDVDDRVRIDRIRALEELKGVLAAAQARETAAFAASQRAAQLAMGVPAERASRGVAGQVALARRTSAFHAARYVGWATVLTRELPGTFRELEAGRTSEWRATLVARETATLTREQRAAVDADLAPHLAGWGDRQVEAEAKKRAYRLDPAQFVQRRARAESERHVGVRPVPDVMARVSALLPVAQAVSVHATLRRDAATLLAAGDPRGCGQIEADLLVERVTGLAAASDVPVEVALVMTDRALFGDGNTSGAATEVDEPAHLDGFGPVPASLARALTVGASGNTAVWLRRVYTDPATGQLAAMDSRRRLFPAAIRRLFRLRDQWCRTPYCGAPIRHADHVTGNARGGPTHRDNGVGRCEACNYAKEAPGWWAAMAGDELLTRTPTGHTYRSRPPDPPGAAPPRPPEEDQVDPAA